jgi:Fe-Mn family superoxide dismutase
VNHAFFWKIIGPDQGTAPSQLGGAITDTFGSMVEFKKQFADVALKRFGSGWVWLSLQHGALKIHSTANQDSPLSDGATPLLGLDVWEHAYYLHYQNRRAEYVAAFWHILNWTQAEQNYSAALKA